MTSQPESSTQGKINPRAACCLVLTVMALIVIIPGLTKPMFSVEVTGALSSQFGRMATPILDQTRSILGTIADLFDQDRAIPGALILLFSVIFPIVKGILVIFSVLTPHAGPRRTLYRIVSAMGKWSMADVFVVAIFLSYLSTTGDTSRQMHEIKVFGMVIPLEVTTKVMSDIGMGFWCFLAYCLLSLLAVTIWQPEEGLYASEQDATERP